MSSTTPHNSSTVAAAQPRASELVRDSGFSDEEDDNDGDEDGQEDEDGDEDWDDWVDDDEAAQAQATKSLFGDTVLSSPEKALIFDQEQFGIDIIDLVSTLGENLRTANAIACVFMIEKTGLDFHQIIRLINYIRTVVRLPLPLHLLNRFPDTSYPLACSEAHA